MPCRPECAGDSRANCSSCQVRVGTIRPANTLADNPRARPVVSQRRDLHSRPRSWLRPAAPGTLRSKSDEHFQVGRQPFRVYGAASRVWRSLTQANAAGPSRRQMAVHTKAVCTTPRIMAILRGIAMEGSRASATRRQRPQLDMDRHAGGLEPLTIEIWSAGTPTRVPHGGAVARCGSRE